MADLTLAIETSNPNSGGEPGVALGRVDGASVTPIDQEPLGAGERHDDLLMPAIARLMGRAGFDAKALDRVVCSTGPGGYTGLRIATAAANMIALAGGARLFGVPSAWVAAKATQEAHTKGPFGVALACKKESAFVTLFDAEGGAMSEGELLGPDQIRGLGITRLLGDRFLPEAMRVQAQRLGIPVIEMAFSAEACLSLAPRAREVGLGELSPMYGREAEAVTKWRELHPDSGV